MRKNRLAAVACLALLAACAGRNPDPVDAVRSTDRTLTCGAIEAEIANNNNEIIELSGEKGRKVAQNVAAGVAGVFIWPIWFAMDFQDAAGKETRALQNRNEYLTRLYLDKGCERDATAAGGTVPTS